ncbi:MAG: hypothetical protein JWQ11_2900 [Rhizobacter sp.]|nr:hypothetical protein [Rhizobacter sp.]
MSRIEHITQRAAKAVLLAVTLSVATLSMAQPRGDDHDRRDDRRGPPMSQRGGPPQRMDDRRDGAGPDHSFRRGGRLPDEYRSRQYVVDDWRGHRLSAPPRGYHWVQTGSDYVLAAIATGIIANILINH